MRQIEAPKPVAAMRLQARRKAVAVVVVLIAVVALLVRRIDDAVSAMREEVRVTSAATTDYKEPDEDPADDLGRTAHLAQERFSTHTTSQM